MMELIEDIKQAHQAYTDTGDQALLLIINDRGSVLAERLGCRTTAAICFAFIMIEASWGRMPTRSDLMKYLPPNTTITDRLSCIWNLIDLKLIEEYQPARDPRRHFFLSQDLCAQITMNISPSKIRNDSLFKETEQIIKLVSVSEVDFKIIHDGKQVGYVLRSSIGNCLEVYWKGRLLFQSDQLNEIIEKLNGMLDKGSLL